DRGICKNQRKLKFGDCFAEHIEVDWPAVTNGRKHFAEEFAVNRRVIQDAKHFGSNGIISRAGSVWRRNSKASPVVELVKLWTDGSLRPRKARDLCGLRWRHFALCLRQYRYDLVVRRETCRSFRGRKHKSFGVIERISGDRVKSPIPHQRRIKNRIDGQRR